MKVLPKDIQKILIIKLRAIGDVLLSTPVLQNLRMQFPFATIDFLTEKFAAPVIEKNPFLNNIISFDKRTTSSYTLIRTIQKNNYDVVIDLFCNPRSAILTRMSGARYRIGFPFRGRGYAYNIQVFPRGDEVHNVDFNLDVLRHLEIPIVYMTPYFSVPPNDVVFAKQWIQHNNLQNKILIALNSTGGWSTKKWGIEKFAQLGDEIVKKFNVAIVLLWGTIQEHNEVEKLQKYMKNVSYIIPSTSLSQMGAILQRCSYIVSNDSGPMHIAAALSVPTVGIFGPTNPYLQGPYGEKNVWVRNEGLECLGCNYTSCSIGNLCMTELSVEKVMNAFNELVERNKQ